MILETSAGPPIEPQLLNNYFGSLVNYFFKVLPMWEKEEETLSTYMRSLQIELMGCGELVLVIRDDSLYLTLLSILQYLIDNPEMAVFEVRREVFRAISICNKLRSRYVEVMAK